MKAITIKELENQIAAARKLGAEDDWDVLVASPDDMQESDVSGLQVCSLVQHKEHFFPALYLNAVGVRFLDRETLLGEKIDV